MISKNSTNRILLGKLMREDIRRKYWMLAITILANFLLGPVAFLFRISSRNYDLLMDEFESVSAWKIRICLDYFNNTHLLIGLVVVYLCAMIAGIFTFRYLYSKRMVDLYHSVPITRKKLFLVGWFDGICIWLLPFLVCQLCNFIIAFIYVGQADGMSQLAASLVKGSLVLLICFLMIYHGCLVPVMVSGNLMNAIVNTLCFGLLLGVGCLVWQGTLQTQYTTYLYNSGIFRISDIAMYLSPLISPTLLYATVMGDYSWLGNGYQLFVCVVVMLLDGLLSFVLYLKRPSELSERGLENKWFRFPFQIIASFVSGLLFALFFSLLQVANTGLAWSLFGALLGAVLCFCVLNIIYNMSFRAIFTKKALLFGVMAACTITTVCIRCDVFHYDSYLPQKKDIKGISMYAAQFADNFSEYYKNEDGTLSRKNTDGSEVTNLLKTTFYDRDAIYALLEELTREEGETDNDYYFGNIYVRVDTTHGAYYRTYGINKKAAYLLKPFVETEEYRENYYQCSSGAFGMPKTIVLYPRNSRTIEIKDADRIAEFMEAYRQDALDNYSLERLAEYAEQSRFELIYSYRGKKSTNTTSMVCYDSISGYSHNILAKLKEWYPNLHFDTSAETIENIDICLYTRSDEEIADDDKSKLYEYFRTPKDDMETAILWEQEWRLRNISQEELKELEPYLYIGSYNNPFENRYVYLGNASILGEYDEPCYIEFGKMPKSLIDKIELVKQTCYE